ncbi:MAG: DUF4199 domain-containing protein [Flavobacteriaceae bacterium]
MEENKISIREYIINYGLLLGIVSIVFSLMLFFLDMHYQNGPFQQAVSFIILSASIIIAFIAYKKDNKGFVSLSECFKMGLGISLLGGLIGFLYFLVLINFIDSEVLEKGFKYQSEIMRMNNPELSQEMIDTAIEMQRKFSSPGIIFVFVMIFQLFIGFIISLIGGLIVKKSRPE